MASLFIASRIGSRTSSPSGLRHDEDQVQRTLWVDSTPAWSVHWTVDWVRVPTDNSYHLTLKTKVNTVLYTSCIAKDHFHFPHIYCQWDKFDHCDHFDVRCESQLQVNFERWSIIIKMLNSCTWTRGHSSWPIHKSLNWSVRLQNIGLATGFTTLVTKLCRKTLLKSWD